MADFDVLIDTGDGLTSAAYVPGTLRIDERLGTATKASFTLLATNPGSHPWTIGDDVAIKSDDGVTTYFNGEITAHPSRPRLSNFDLWEIPVSCLGDDARLDRVRITRTYTWQYAQDIISSINDNDLGAFFSTTLIDTYRIKSISFNGVTAREALNDVVEATARQGKEFLWRVTADNDIVFKRRLGATTAAWSIAAGSTPIDPLTLSTSRRRGAYYNAGIVRGGMRLGEEITEQVTFDKTQVEWSMKHPVAGFDSDGDGKVVFGTHTSDARQRGAYDETAETDVFEWRPDSHHIKAVALAGWTGSGDQNLNFTYRPKVPVVWAYRDEIDIAARGGIAGGGLYETPTLFVPRLSSTLDAIDYLRAYIERYSSYEVITVSFDATTLTSGVTLLTVGETMDISIPEDGIDGTFVIDAVMRTDKYRQESWAMRVTAHLGEVVAAQQTMLRDAVGTNVDGQDFAGGVGSAEPVAVASRTEDLEISVTMTVNDV